MSAKERKSAVELEELIMTGFRKHSELNGVFSVVVTTERFRPGCSTWECHLIADNPAQARGIIADLIIRQFQVQFDLADGADETHHAMAAIPSPPCS
jgi:hypothetical protein